MQFGSFFRHDVLSAVVLASLRLSLIRKNKIAAEDLPAANEEQSGRPLNVRAAASVEDQGLGSP